MLDYLGGKIMNFVLIISHSIVGSFVIAADEYRKWYPEVRSYITIVKTMLGSVTVGCKAADAASSHAADYRLLKNIW